MNISDMEHMSAGSESTLDPRGGSEVNTPGGFGRFRKAKYLIVEGTDYVR